jgi:hypothetical protein
MIKTAALAIAMAAILSLGTAQAASTDLYVSLFGAERTPDIDPADGTVRAFMCLSQGQPQSPTEECFAFHPRPETIRNVKLSDGGAITRSQTGAWTETPGNFHFVQKSLTKDRLVIVDPSRGMTWSLALPRGGSTIRTNAAAADWYQVTGVGYDPAPAGYVAAPEIAQHALQDHPARPQSATAMFVRKVDPRLRTDLYSIVNAWNAKSHALTGADCLGLIDAVAATVGAKRPPRGHDATAAAYVGDLIKLNP